MSATAPTGKVDKEDSAEGWNAANNQDVKRWGILILVCLLLGVVTTVAVAWYCARAVAIGKAQRVSLSLNGSEPTLKWYTCAGAAAFEMQDGWYRSSTDALEWAASQREQKSLEVLPDWGRDWYPTAFEEYAEGFCPRIRDGRGWPFIAFYSDSIYDPTQRDASRHFFVHNGQVIPSTPVFKEFKWGIPINGGSARLDGPACLPFHPAWHGFLADTFSYAALIFISICTFRILKKRRRLRLGHCSSCGYSLTGNMTGRCPECGSVTTAVRAASS